jgi:hypothetical protein
VPLFCFNVLLFDFDPFLLVPQTPQIEPVRAVDPKERGLPVSGFWVNNPSTKTLSLVQDPEGPE